MITGEPLESMMQPADPFVSAGPYSKEAVDTLRALANRYYKAAPGNETREETAFTAPEPVGMPHRSNLGTVDGRCTQPGSTYPSATHEPLAKPANMDGRYYFLPEHPPEPTAPIAHKRDPGWTDTPAIRQDFPILQRLVHGKPLVWLDNAATTQKPACVIEAISRYYRESNSNVHRGAHQLAREATEAYEEARKKISNFIGAASPDEIIFTRGTTEAINLAAMSWGAMHIRPGDEILLTMMEHHSNIVPWQMLAEKNGAFLRAVPFNEDGELMLLEYEKLFTPRTRMAAFTHVSNVLGTVNPVKKMIETAHRYGVCTLVDGAQSVPHMSVNVWELDADFFAFSGHKMYGPTGTGVLYGKRARLEEMPPWQGGGGMIKNVTFARTEYDTPPKKFEAGTGNIADAVGLGAAADYLMSIGMENIRRQEKELTAHAMKGLAGIHGVRLIGTAPEKAGTIAFILNGIEPEGVAKYLDKDGIAVRAGHHCAQPILKAYGLAGTVRASIGIYNTVGELDSLIRSVEAIAMRYR